MPKTPQPNDGETIPQDVPVPRTGEDGEPIYDREFFLVLARHGKDVWNRWRAQNPGVKPIPAYVIDMGLDFDLKDMRFIPQGPEVAGEPQHIKVNFEGVDFSEPGNANIDFSGFNFGDDATFKGCRFGDGRPISLFGHSREFRPGMAKFSGASFGARANLSEAQFGHSADFCLATFGGSADLSRTAFGMFANFSGATFGDGAYFSGISFGRAPDLSAATFGLADFTKAIFGARANLEGATFGPSTKLVGATFGRGTNLSGAAFGHRCDLSGATFIGKVQFDARTEKYRRNHRSSLLRNDVSASWSEDRKQAFLNLPEATAPPDAFLDCDFDGAYFGGVADFSGRKLDGRLDLTHARFDRPPIFDQREDEQNINFYGTTITFGGAPLCAQDWADDEVFNETGIAGSSRWRNALYPVSPLLQPICRGWTTSSVVALRLRALRALAEATKNHDLERDLYIEERKAERGILFAQYWSEGWKGILGPGMFSHLLWLLIMFGYSLLADFGRSVLRPLAGLAVSVFVFHWAYASVLTAPSDPARLEDFRRSVWAFAVSSAVPFVGALTLEGGVKLALLCGDQPTDPATALRQSMPQCVPVPGRRFQLLVLLQSILSSLCLFFVALALRNFFKLK
jgi:uncharacterized protein YjbI with pentapeptide repeats